MGFRIFIHAISLVFNHIGPALRISGLLYFIPVLGLQLTAGTVASVADAEAMTRSPWTYLFALASVIASLWIAVAWHRYVLMDETPGAVLPPFHGRRILGYFGYSLLVGLILFVAAFVVFIPIGFIGGTLAVAGGAAVSLLLLLPTIVGYFVIAYVAYRLSTVLPASAVEKPISIGTAWAATSGASGPLLMLAFLSAVSVVVLGLVIGWVSVTINFWLGTILQLIVSWLELLAGVSIITTLYGHYVEKRPID